MKYFKKIFKISFVSNWRMYIWSITIYDGYPITKKAPMLSYGNDFAGFFKWYHRKIPKPMVLWSTYVIDVRYVMFFFQGAPTIGRLFIFCRHLFRHYDYDNYFLKKHQFVFKKHISSVGKLWLCNNRIRNNKLEYFSKHCENWTLFLIRQILKKIKGFFLKGAYPQSRIPGSTGKAYNFILIVITIKQNMTKKAIWTDSLWKV